MSPTYNPDKYLEWVYAGVLGKIIGVYLGRPFENWTYERITEELGEIRYYVNDKLGEPLVVTDDDVAGTFTFIRALEEHGFNPEISAEQIGKTWLNHVIEDRSIFWWGGNGISTEHTAFVNLTNGIPAPQSGAIATNGKTIAEQIGAQIFIDGWAMVAPGNPALAAQLAEKAGSVSHDGESVYAAKLLAAMEAEAFVSKDPNHLIDTGLRFVPRESQIAQLVSDIRNWVEEDQDWKRTRARIQAKYGYDKYGGFCHVIPNHGLIIMSLLYGGHSFKEALHIVNTCGWDTDCNGGNIGCLLALMHGMEAFEEGLEFRAPIADQALISSGDPGYSMNNATRIAYDIANAGLKMAANPPLPPPKNGAQYHFSLHGGVQGFRSSNEDVARVFQGVKGGRKGLGIELLSSNQLPAEVFTETFTPPTILDMKTYDLMAAPLVYPGHAVHAIVNSEAAATICFRIMYYGTNNTATLQAMNGPLSELAPGKDCHLEWTIPDLDGQPIQKIGIAVAKGTGTIWLDRMYWNGAPATRIRRPQLGDAQFWSRSFVKGVQKFHEYMPNMIIAAQDQGEGVLMTGTRDWKNYQLNTVGFSILRGNAGIMFRCQALNRYYSILFCDQGEVRLIKARDQDRTILAKAPFQWQLDQFYQVTIVVNGTSLEAQIKDGPALRGLDREYEGGGVGLVVISGSARVTEFDVKPV